MCSLFGLVTITSLNYYGASLTLLSVMDSVRPSPPTLAKRILTLVASAVVATATSLALVSSQNFVAKFGEFLAVLLYLFTPWTAINLVDFYYVRKGHYSVREIFNCDGMYGRWNWRGLWAYGIESGVIPFQHRILEGAGGKGARRCRYHSRPAGIGFLVNIAACRSLDVAGPQVTPPTWDWIPTPSRVEGRKALTRRRHHADLPKGIVTGPSNASPGRPVGIAVGELPVP